MAPNSKTIEATTSKIITNLSFVVLNLVKIIQLILQLSHENQVSIDDDGDTDDNSAIPIIKRAILLHGVRD